MVRQHTQLAAGVALLTEQTTQFKTGLFTVTLTVPLRREAATACALIPEVLYRGTNAYPNIVSLSAATDNLYGAAFEVGVRQRGESQCVCFQCSFIDDAYTLNGVALLEPAIDLTAEILLNPLTENGVFYREYVIGEGINLADQIQARINDKTEWAIFRLISEMCVGESYAIDKLGDAQEAMTMTPTRLWENYQELLSNSMIVFYYNGSAAHERVESAVRRAFRGILSDRAMNLDCSVISGVSDSVQMIKEEMDVTQSKLVLGFRTGGVTMGHPYFPALLVCNALYGGAGTSKLFTNVRERLGLCYSVSSLIDKLKGIMVVISGVDITDLNSARKEILAQLDAICKGDISSQELNAAIRYVACSIACRKDSQSQMEEDAVTGFLSTGGWADNDDLLKAVEKVTAEQVTAAARLLCLDTVFCLTGKEDE